jgi:DNA-binding XRE family transcriptional regulator
MRLSIHKNLIYTPELLWSRAGVGSRDRGSAGLRASEVERSTMMPVPGPIAVKLRVLREERGLTHKEAAELTNVSHWTLIDLESGK